MGTSSRNMGQKGHSPLVPSWLEEGGSGEISDPIPENGDTERFSKPRGNMTRYAVSGGERNLQKAVSRYVRHASGGVENAVKRLGSARNSTATLVGVWGSFSRGGVVGVQDFLKTYNLIGKTADEAFRAITDLICDDGGPTNEGIVRDAYLEALAESTDLRNVNFEDLKSGQIMDLLQGMITNIIMEKLINDVANKILFVPDSLKKAGKVKKRIKGYIKGVVSDTFSKLDIKAENIRADQSHQVADRVYTQVYLIFAENEV